MKRLISVKELAEALNFSTAKIYSVLSDDPDFPRYREPIPPGSNRKPSFRFDLDEVKDYLRQGGWQDGETTRAGAAAAD